MNKETFRFIAEPGKQEVHVVRVLDAPRDLVFKVYTSPEHIPHWWGPRRLTTEVDKMEARPGGLWRYINRDSAGNAFAFHGVYHDVTPERIVNTFEFEGMPGHVLLDTTTFESLPDGKTRVTGVSIFQSIEETRAMIDSGMEEGAREMWERFAELIATMPV